MHTKPWYGAQPVSFAAVHTTTPLLAFIWPFGSPGRREPFISPQSPVLSYMCRAVLLAFSRDGSVRGKAAVSALPCFATTSISTPQQCTPMQLYPASGIMPFQGLSAYLAPLCYLYSSPAALYPVWHAMYCQFWCYLHTLNSSAAPAAGLPLLCRTFLDLLQVRHGIDTNLAVVQPHLTPAAEAVL